MFLLGSDVGTIVRRVALREHPPCVVTMSWVEHVGDDHDLGYLLLSVVDMVPVVDSPHPGHAQHTHMDVTNMPWHQSGYGPSPVCMDRQLLTEAFPEWTPPEAREPATPFFVLDASFRFPY